ncbi:Zinc knuckle [Phytophthora infestans]|uniref:Zinc knuckle n=1 Tax=Phytophthora infestans TaxID=4787 RepID=A0A8S9UIA9_PHYIN|nr:Zinc knuckle [Phytophthora infestans]
MSKYTPDFVRELILTAETRSKDWEKSAFGNNQGKKKQGNASSGHKSSQNKTTGDANKKRTAKADVECFNCGGKGHYKHQCPDLEDKPREKKSAKAKMARSDVKPAAQVTADATVEDTRMHKREVVLGEVVKRVAKDYDSSRWYFDSGTNVHIVASKEYFTVLNNMEDSDWNPTI